MRLTSTLIAVTLVILAVYVGLFHALVAWRGQTIITVYGTPTHPMQQTQRKIHPAGLFPVGLEQQAITLFTPLAELENWLSKTALSRSDPCITELHDALLMHAQVGDAQAAEGLTITALHVLTPGPPKNPTPSEINIRFRGNERWIFLSNFKISMENALYVHNGTRIRRYLD